MSLLLFFLSSSAYAQARSEEKIIISDSSDNVTLKFSKSKNLQPPKIQKNNKNTSTPKFVVVYRYVDEKGVIHLTNKNKQDKPYEEFMRFEAKKILSMIPPGEVRNMARRYARKHKVDPRLVEAVISVESAWDMDAVSHAGAQGLMQIMPGTQQDLGITEPFDPDQNIDGGVRYLKEMLDRFGDIKLALAAYNAGPERVSRHGGIPPIKETQEYVAKVLGLYKNKF